VCILTGAAAWRNMSLVERAPWKRLSEKASHEYKMQKRKQQDKTILYSLTQAGLAAATKLKKKAVATASAKVKAKAKSAAKKKVTFKKATKNVRVQVFDFLLV